MRTTPIPTDGRGTLHLESTAAGMRVVQAWALDIKPSDILINDLLLSRLCALQFADPGARRDWIEKVCAMTEQMIGEIERKKYGMDPFWLLACDSKVAMLRSHLRWFRSLPTTS
ncbi:hypothetical protein [Sphingosinicella sp.]|uniref:hypothetical protein n=1 Tax=Sphingosinicella sp. TaxID=1917971 RepID=UPI004037FD62